MKIIESKKETSTGNLYHYCPINNLKINKTDCTICTYHRATDENQASYKIHCGATGTAELIEPDPAKAYDTHKKLKGLALCESGDHIWIEPKLDGVRAIVHCTPNGVFITTRRRDKTGSYSQIQNNVPHLRGHSFLEELGKSGYTILDGEVIVPVVNEQTLPLTMGVVGSKPERAIALQQETGMWLSLNIFDILFLDGQDIRQNQFYLRRSILETKIPNDIPHIRLVDGYVELDSRKRKQAYHEALDNGLEGIIIKDRQAAYGASHAWLKVKEKITLDAIVTGFEAGSVGGKYQDTIGAFNVAVRTPTGALEEIAKVSPGDDLTRAEMYAKLNGLTEQQILDLGIVVEMEAQRWTTGENPRLRHPRIVRYRPDRSEPNTVDLSQYK
jgi:ATP-dependent DNA ligase